MKKDGTVIEKETALIVKKLEEISCIQERRYIEDHHDSALMSVQAAEKALESAQLDKEDLDQIIVGHNFGNMRPNDTRSYLVPNLAARIKNHLQIKNHRCAAFDLLYGCPGWVQAMIQAHESIQVGSAKNILVMGVEVISRLLDPHDLDSMLFADGAGAVVLTAKESQNKKGVLATLAYSHCLDDLDFIEMGGSSNPNKSKDLHVKMQGKSVFKYAMSNLPDLITECLEKAEIPIQQVDKFLFHQANGKMLRSIASKLFKMHNVEGDIDKLMPLTVQHFGNSSVATIPTMLDLILRDQMTEHQIKEDDIVVMCSVGAGMHANCLVYQF